MNEKKHIERDEIRKSIIRYITKVESQMKLPFLEMGDLESAHEFLTQKKEKLEAVNEEIQEPLENQDYKNDLSYSTEFSDYIDNCLQNIVRIYKSKEEEKRKADEDAQKQSSTYHSEGKMNIMKNVVGGIVAQQSNVTTNNNGEKAIEYSMKTQRKRPLESEQNYYAKVKIEEGQHNDSGKISKYSSKSEMNIVENATGDIVAQGGNVITTYESENKNKFPKETQLGRTIASNEECVEDVKLKTAYLMNKTLKSKGVIISNDKFKISRAIPSHKEDSERLKMVFEQFRFEIEIKQNKTSEQMLQIFDDYSKMDFEKFNALVVIIFSHGGGTGPEGTDGKQVAVKDIFEKFNGINCRSLLGKPKIFLFQMCRGHKYNMKILKTREHPTVSDVLLSFDTLEGYLSLIPEEEEGSYAQHLCDCLEEFADTNHLEEILKEVDKKLREDFKSYNVTQVTETRNLGFRNFYFNPIL